MAYFPNGTAGTMYQERYCCRCLNYRDKGDGRGLGCAVWDAHILFDTHYTPKEGGPPKPTRESHVLDVLIPRAEDKCDNEECAMFLDDGKDHDTLPLFPEGS